MTEHKKPRGRPVEHKLPDPIPDTPENIMKAFLKTPPRKREEWKFVQEREKKTELEGKGGGDELG